MLEKNCELVPIENISKANLTKITLNYNFDLDGIKKKIEEEMNKKNLNKKIEKILLSLQNFENKDYLLGTIFISGMGIIKVRMTLPDLNIEEFEKKTMKDFKKFCRIKN